MEKYFLYNPLTRMFLSGKEPHVVRWGNSYSEIKPIGIDEAKAIRKGHFEKWGEDIWIVLFEPIA